MSEYTILRPCESADSTINENARLPRTPYAMAFVEPQRWERPLSAADALANGTAFYNLVKPFWAMEVHQ